MRLTQAVMGEFKTKALLTKAVGLMEVLDRGTTEVLLKQAITDTNGSFVYMIQLFRASDHPIKKELSFGTNLVPLMVNELIKEAAAQTKEKKMK